MAAQDFPDSQARRMCARTWPRAASSRCRAARSATSGPGIPAADCGASSRANRVAAADASVLAYRASASTAA